MEGISITAIAALAIIETRLIGGRPERKHCFGATQYNRGRNSSHRSVERFVY